MTPATFIAMAICQVKISLFESAHEIRVSIVWASKVASGEPVYQCNLARLLTLNAPITTKAVCFFHLLKCLRSLYGKQCGPRSDCSYRSSLFLDHAVCFYTYSSVMLGNYLQQTTSGDDIFRYIFSWRLKG